MSGRPPRAAQTPKTPKPGPAAPPSSQQQQTQNDPGTGEMTPARRPKLGTKGRRLQVGSNAFNVSKMPTFNVHHYDVTITPEVPSKFNRQIFKRLQDVDKFFGEIKAVYDGQKNCFAPKALPFGGEPKTFETILPEDDGDGDAAAKKEAKGPAPKPKKGGAGGAPAPKAQASPARSGRSFKVTFKKVAEVNLEELSMFLKNKASVNGNILAAIVALNVMIRHGPSALYPNKASSIYPPPQGRQAFNISGALELWRGYFSSIRPAPGKLILNVDITAMPFIRPGELPQVVQAYLNVRDVNDIARFYDRQRTNLERFLKGVRVVVHQNDPQKPRMHYKIKSLSRESASKLSFEMEGGKKVTVQQYFEKQYNVRLRYPNLPCVQVTKKAFYPMELCTVELGNKYVKKLDPDQVAEALKFTTMKPNDRMFEIKKGLQILNYGNDEYVKGWEFGIESENMKVQARVLDPPMLLLKDQKGLSPLVPRDGAWDMRGKAGMAPATINVWGVIVFESENPVGRSRGYPRQLVQENITALIAACKGLGIRFAPGAHRPEIHYAGAENMAVRDAFVALSKQIITASQGTIKPGNIQMVLCFLPEKNARQYPLIKQTGDLGIGVATQALLCPKTARAKDSYWSNVALKINIKLKGVNQQIDRPSLPVVADGDTIIFGADVTHPGPGSMSPSIAGVCATIDGTATTYSASVRVQSSRVEVIADLAEMTKELVAKFKNAKGQRVMPKKIIFYRDGVSEGQFAEVFGKEVAALKTACKEMSPDYRPKITYVVCGKRHHFRFFPLNPSDGDKSGNARAGTIVDTDVVHPFEYDWYLQSHGGLLGTSRPTHYNVLLDENNIDVDALQQLTYNLCYLYARSTRSVSMVSPAYYAHHVCTRARYHLGTDQDDSTTQVSGSLASSQEDRLRDEKLSAAKARLSPVKANLEGTLYFL